MKLSKLFFWKSKAAKRRSESPSSDGATSGLKINTSECVNEQPTRPRSASFSGAETDGKGETSKEVPKVKVNRSHSMGHKVKRRNSFVRFFKAARDIGRTLRQIGDDLESRHSGSSLSVGSRLR